MRQDLGKLLLRLALGGLVLLHGIARLVAGPAALAAAAERAGLPGVIAYLAYVGEVAAPLALIAGWWTRTAATLVALTVAALTLLAHGHELAALARGGGWALEAQGMFFFAAVAIALLGAGRYSIDGR